MTFLDSLRRTRLVGILRGVEFGELQLVSRVCVSAKLEFVEITLNTRDALSKIASLIELSNGNLTVGAGTVLSVGELQDAASAGAKFIVSPVCDAAVAKAARDLDIPYIPGALTPQEIWNAHQLGATLVKVFPAQCYGPKYIRELRGPFAGIPLLACGGVGPSNVGEYLDAGIDAAALGGSTFQRSWLASDNTSALLDALQTVIAAVTAFEEKRHSKARE